MIYLVFTTGLLGTGFATGAHGVVVLLPVVPGDGGVVAGGVTGLGGFTLFCGTDSTAGGAGCTGADECGAGVTGVCGTAGGVGITTGGRPGIVGGCGITGTGAGS